MLPRSLRGGIEREFIVRKLSINGTTFVSTSNQQNGVQTIFTKQFGDDKNDDFQLARHGTISFSSALRQCPLWCGAAWLQAALSVQLGWLRIYVTRDQLLHSM